MDVFDRILELDRQGLYCAQIMVQLALDAEGKENPELITAVRGLCGTVCALTVVFSVCVGVS